MITVPIEVSARHAHLTQRHVDFLFGRGHTLTPLHPVSQTGQFSCVETVDLVGNKGFVLKHVRIVGPARPESQVEAAITDIFHLHKKPTLKVSGKLKGAESIIVKVGRRRVLLPHGLMVTKRHIHCPPARAKKYGLKHLEEVSVRVGGERGVIFNHVVIRIHPSYVWSFQIDTDEANAAGIRGGERGVVLID